MKQFFCLLLALSAAFCLAARAGNGNGPDPCFPGDGEEGRRAAEAGSFRLDFFEERGLDFTDVIVNEEAQPIALLPLEEVREFALEKLTWDDETFRIIGAETVFSADTLVPGENLKIHCWFSDVLPDLRVRCVNAEGQAECWYLFQSGKDGSLLLLGEEETTGSGEEEYSW